MSRHPDTGACLSCPPRRRTPRVSEKVAQLHIVQALRTIGAAVYVLAERVSWGRWRRAADEVVVFSGRDSLLPASPATGQPS